MSRPVKMARTKTEKVSYVTLEKFDNLNLLAWRHFKISSVLEFNMGWVFRLDVIYSELFREAEATALRNVVIGSGPFDDSPCN